MTLTTRRLSTLVLFLSLFIMAMRVSVDTDTFWHLRSGAWMLDNARVLTIDVFSYTRLNQAWLNHSWLAQIPMALIYRVSGYGGLNLITALLITITFAVVYFAGDGGSYLKPFIVIVAAATSGIYWSARPHLLSLLFLAIFTLILYDYVWRNINRLWLLPPLMLLWANLHGGFAIGFILLIAIFVGEVLKELVVGTINSKAKPLAFVGVACAIAACINPYGVQILSIPFRTVSVGVLQNYIQEWQSPNFHLPAAQVFILMLLGVVASIGFARRRLDLTDFLIFATFATLALITWRNVAAFAVVIAPLWMRYADSAVSELQNRFPQLRIEGNPNPSKQLQFSNWLIVVAVAAVAVLRVATSWSERVNLDALGKTVPVQAVEYLRANPSQGKMFNAYNFGGYLLWTLYPDELVYVDGRTDLYDDELLTEYLNTALTNKGWEQTLKDRGIRVVIVESESPLAQALAASPNWIVKYSDPLASVIVKNQ